MGIVTAPVVDPNAKANPNVMERLETLSSALRLWMQGGTGDVSRYKQILADAEAIIENYGDRYQYSDSDGSKMSKREMRDKANKPAYDMVDAWKHRKTVKGTVLQWSIFEYVFLRLCLAHLPENDTETESKQVAGDLMSNVQQERGSIGIERRTEKSKSGLRDMFPSRQSRRSATVNSGPSAFGSCQSEFETYTNDNSDNDSQHRSTISGGNSSHQDPSRRTATARERPYNGPWSGSDETLV